MKSALEVEDGYSAAGALTSGRTQTLQAPSKTRIEHDRGGGASGADSEAEMKRLIAARSSKLALAEAEAYADVQVGTNTLAVYFISSSIPEKSAIGCGAYSGCVMLMTAAVREKSYGTRYAPIFSKLLRCFTRWTES